MIENCNNLNPIIWGPHYWFVLHTIALTYPDKPNETIKKKYYDLIQNLPLFIPNVSVSKDLVILLDNFPVTPYLESKESFMKWTHFLHNHINTLSEKSTVTYNDSLKIYFDHYKSNDYMFKKKHNIIKNVLFLLFIFILLIIILLLYKK